MSMIKLSYYGKNKSDKFNGRSVKLILGDIILYFSFDTIVAFEYDGELYCSKNKWSNTSGRHLNLIQPDKKKRIHHFELIQMLDRILAQSGFIEY